LTTLLRAAVLLLCSAAASATEAPRLELFVLHSYSQEYPWTQDQHEGFMAELRGAPRRHISSRIEYLDTKRIPYDERYARAVAEHLANKYVGYAPDAIYVTDDNALAFAHTHLARLFPDAPVFFSGVNDYGIRERVDRRRFTGVFERKEIAPNLELVRGIAPDLARIVVLGDASETYRAIESEIRRELENHPEISATFISSGHIEEVLDALRANDDQFLFLTTLGAMSDASGHLLSLAEILSAIVDAGERTIISMEDAYLFPRVLGGYVTSGVRQGREAARLLERYLAGTPIERLPPVEQSPNEYSFDDAELARTGLRLPEPIARVATIRNPLPSFHERNQSLIVGSLYALALMFGALLLALLAVTMVKNRAIVRHTGELREQTAKMAEIQESLTRAQSIASMGNWDWHIREDRVYWSDGIYRLIGLKPGAFGASHEALVQCVHPKDRESVRAAVRNALDAGDAYEIELRVVRPDGAIRVVRENAEVVRDASGEPVRMIGTVLDITEQKRTAQALRKSEAQLRTVVEGLPVVLWMIDADGRFVLSEGHGLLSLGLRPGEVVGRSLFELYENEPGIIGDAQRALGGESFEVVRWVGSTAFELRYSPLRDARGAIEGAIGVAVDVTERKRSEDRLSFLANFDPVTSLPNRFLFRDRLLHAMERARRDRSRVALLFVDLDHFKTINDTLGHAEGDELLKQVAERLRSSVRGSDTVSRLGGDEFTVILEELDDGDQAVEVAAKLLAQSEHPYRLGSSEVYVSPSIGIAIHPEDGASVDELLMNADAAMYRAKDNGRRTFQFFTPEISTRAQERLTLHNELRGALERGEFSLHYQPKVELDNGTVIGFEALLRWTGAAIGVSPPAQFVPALEETGLIVEIGEWVVVEACRWAAMLNAEGDSGPSVSVNVSARQFREPDLDRVVERALRETGLRPDRLELEITESSLVDLETNLRTMDRLKQLGVRLSIDDFGTGYSSLSYLKRLPLDRLKVDASFVRDVAVDADDAAIVTAIIGLAHNLSLHVIAEGVETRQQLDYLRDEGCDEIQGYLLARPMTSDDARVWLREWPGRMAQAQAATLPGSG
jgi:diguanylate cyclase (GGDEF)-like protein/PAS domain S-box-containing protein